MTFSMLYAFSEHFVLPISHDEVVHGKGTLWTRMPGDDHHKAAGLRTLLAYQWAHPGKQLLFMGQEFGQRAEWCNERGVDWFQLDPASEPDGYSPGILRLVADLNAHYRALPALWSQDSDPRGYSWIDANDSASNVLSFLRYGADGSVLACVFNFAGVTHADYHLGLPQAGRWREVLNTDAAGYRGSGQGNLGGVEATDAPWHGRPASTVLVLPALSAVWLAPE
jgi:1,4-alpha-glucan branching enzyme